jgi:hypothetical protein
MKPRVHTQARPRPLARARAMIRTEIGSNLRDSMVYGRGAAFAVLVAGLGLAAL